MNMLQKAKASAAHLKFRSDLVSCTFICYVWPPGQTHQASVWDCLPLVATLRMSPGAVGQWKTAVCVSGQSPVRGITTCMAVRLRGGLLGRKGLQSCGWTHPVCPEEAGLLARGLSQLWCAEHQG